MRPHVAAERLNALRRKIARIEGVRAQFAGRHAVPFKIPAIDAALGAGLARGAIHELSPTDPVHRGATFGLALALACRACARRAGDILWIETAFATAETGRIYGLGVEAFGPPLARVLIMRVTRPVDVLWAMEEALGSRGIAVVIATLAHHPDLTTTRRLSLAVRASGGLGLLVLQRVSPHPSAALTRWQVAAAPSRPDAFGGLGLPAFDLTLTKNRYGPCGRWTIFWDAHERAFVDPLSVPMAAAAGDRSDHARRGESARGRAGRVLRHAG
jgi:protein ImuA